MFVGHYGISFIAGKMAPQVPLWTWFIAVQWPDVIWSILVLLGVERLRIVPGFTEANALDLYFMPFTHSLPGSLVLSALLGGIVAALVPTPRWRTFLLVSFAAFSHWLLDFIVHTPDLPLYGDTAKIGLGLWQHVAISFPLELALLAGGAWIYSRAAPSNDRSGEVALWSFVALLAAMQIYANFGPPPASDTQMALIALGFYVVFAAMAYGVERIRGVERHYKTRQAKPAAE